MSPVDAQSPPPKKTMSLLRGWGVVALVGIGIWAVFFGIPTAVRMLKAPPISEGFGLEDAVVALRLQADDVSYLVLVTDAGQTRSVELAERGFESSELVWSADGLSTGGPEDEYVLHEDGLTSIPLPPVGEAPSEHSRFAVDGGFAVHTGSAQGQQLAFVDAAAGTLAEADLGYSSLTFGVCDGDLVVVGEDGVRTVTAESTDVDGFSVFDGVDQLVCDQDHLYGLDEIVDEGGASHQTLRVWDRATGAVRETEIRYPEEMFAWMSGTPFVWEGRLYWAAGATLWSVPVTAEGSEVDADAAAELSGFIGDVWPVVGTDQGVLAEAGGLVFGAAVDEEFINPSRGETYDKLLELAIFSADVNTGERRIEIDVDDIDFPRKDLHITAIAVDPEWAAGR